MRTTDYTDKTDIHCGMAFSLLSLVSGRDNVFGA
jgi:hypothetical protein